MTANSTTQESDITTTPTNVPLSQPPWVKWLAIVGSVGLILMIGLWGWVLQTSSLGLLWKPPVDYPITAMFVGKQSPLMISLQTNLDRLEGLRETIITPSQRRSSHQQLIELEKQILKPFGLNYQDHIAPWLGDEITWAMTSTDYDRLPDNGLQPGYIVILSSRNHITSEEIIEKYWRGFPTTDTQSNEIYQGVKINYHPQSKIATGIVGKKYVILANHPQVLKNAINNAHSEKLSIISHPDYQNLTSRLSQGHIASAYLNLHNLKPLLDADLSPLDRSLGVTWQLKSSQLTTRILTLNSTSQSKLPQINQTQEIIKYIPKNSSLAIAGINLSNLDSQLSTIFPLSAKKITDRLFQSLNNLVNLDIQTRILPWVTGEYGLAIVANPKQENPDWVIVTQRTEPESADQFIQELDRLVAKQNYEVRPIPWEKYQVTGWTKLVTTSQSQTQLLAQVGGVHTTIGDYEILASSVPVLGQVLGGWGESIRQNSAFKSALNQLPPQSAGYIYFDWEEIQSLLSPYLKKTPLLSKLFSVTFNPLKHNTINTSVDGDGRTTTTIISAR